MKVHIQKSGDRPDYLTRRLREEGCNLSESLKTIIAKFGLNKEKPEAMGVISLAPLQLKDLWIQNLCLNIGEVIRIAEEKSARLLSFQEVLYSRRRYPASYNESMIAFLRVGEGDGTLIKFFLSSRKGSPCLHADETHSSEVVYNTQKLLFVIKANSSILLN